MCVCVSMKYIGKKIVYETQQCNKQPAEKKPKSNQQQQQQS